MRRQELRACHCGDRKYWGERQRFTLAHELGHLVMDVAAKLDEKKAMQRFAGVFLMPANALWQKNRQTPEIHRLE